MKEEKLIEIEENLLKMSDQYLADNVKKCIKKIFNTEETNFKGLPLMAASIVLCAIINEVINDNEEITLSLIDVQFEKNDEKTNLEINIKKKI